MTSFELFRLAKLKKIKKISILYIFLNFFLRKFNMGDKLHHSMKKLKKNLHQFIV